ncbi:Fic family protein [Pseudomonas coleopterorum]|nr:Fic family protein [Pseudomonas coleopterorum]
MSSPFVSGNHWLEPIMPSPDFPPSLMHMAEQLPFQAGKLCGVLPTESARRIGGLMRITSSYYSNLIEGQYTEPASLSANAPRRNPKVLTELAVSHIGAQEALERLLRTPRGSTMEWAGMFAPSLVARVHRRLFAGAGQAELALTDGRELVPGQLRNVSEKNVMVGDHFAPAWQSILPMMSRLQTVYGRIGDQRTRLLGALAYHHRLAFVHPFEDGNGRVVRMLTHLQLAKLGLVSPLWSLSRGLARQQDEYYRRLRSADQPRRGDLDGRGQLTQSGLLEFVEFMLQVCLDQMKYIEHAMGMATLRQRLERAIAFEPRFEQAGIKQEVARALHILLTHGEVSRSDFKIYTGLHDRVASGQLNKLVTLGLVDAPSVKSRQLYPGLPVWFAQLLFPDLHRRFDQ